LEYLPNQLKVADKVLIMPLTGITTVQMCSPVRPLKRAFACLIQLPQLFFI